MWRQTSHRGPENSSTRSGHPRKRICGKGLADFVGSYPNGRMIHIYIPIKGLVQQALP
jgi:hypothetical protein